MCWRKVIKTSQWLTLYSVLAKEHLGSIDSNLPEVGNEVETEDFSKAFVVRPSDDDAEPDSNTDIR